MTSQTSAFDAKLAKLQEFSACDVSDALLKLQKVNTAKGEVARAGFLADLKPIPTGPSTTTKLAALASTFKFIPKTSTPSPPSPETAIPKDTHWADTVRPNTVVVIEQPEGQSCAAVGGIMALRMGVLGARGVVVGGRVRDVEELGESGLPIWSRGTSTVGSGAESKPGAREVPVSISGVTVNPGDIIFCDAINGTVAIPADLLDDVLELMPKLVAADDKVKEAVKGGMSVFEAFKTFRG